MKPIRYKLSIAFVLLFMAIFSVSAFAETPKDEDFNYTGISGSQPLELGNIKYSSDATNVNTVDAHDNFGTTFSTPGTTDSLFADYVIVNDGNMDGSSTRFSFESKDWSNDFRLVSFAICAHTIDGWIDGRKINIKGYNDNVVVAELNESIDLAIGETYGVSETPGTEVVYDLLYKNEPGGEAFYGGKLTFGSKWSNVDKIEITSADGNTLYYGIDSIDFSDPVLPGPKVTSVAVPAVGTYNTNYNLDFLVNFDENVTVTGTDSVLNIAVGSTTKQAIFQSAEGKSITYRYTIKPGDNDTDGIILGGIDLKSSTIRNSKGENATLKLNNVGDTSGVKVDTTVPTPTILNISDDTGTFDNDRITKDNTITITGKAKASCTVNIFRDSSLLKSVSASAITGDWSVTTGELNDGSYSFTATATDSFGVTSTTSAPISVIIDTQPPNAPTAPGLVSDTGKSSTDNYTNNTTPTFAGEGVEANSVINLFMDGKSVGTATADGSGKWSINSSEIKSDGVHLFTYTVTDKAGNTSTPSPGLEVTIDTEAPSAPTGLTLAAASDTGSSNTDKVTNDTTPTISGTAAADSTINLYIDGAPAGTADANSSGAWTIDCTPAIAVDGKHTFTATATDLAGNKGAVSMGLEITIDTKATAPSAPDLVAAYDSGVSDSDNITNITKPVFSGTADAGDTVSLYKDDVLMGTTTAQNDGKWAYTCIAALADGKHAITAIATDYVGNISTTSAGLEVTIDTQAPNAPSAPDLIPESDTGDSQTDNITYVTTPSFIGTADPNTEISIVVGGFTQGTTTSDKDGKWSYTSTKLGGGNDVFYIITAVATDAAGNSAPSASFLKLYVDTEIDKPTITSISDDNGYSSTDGITNDDTLTINGTTETGNKVTVLIDGAAIGTANVDGSGKWSFAYTTPIGNHTFTAIAEDTAGNISTVSNSFDVIINKTAPNVVSIKTLSQSPTNSDTLTYCVTFDKPVTGIDVSDFELTKVGTAFGKIKSVSSDNGKTVNVTVDSVAGDGQLRLDLKNGTDIEDVAGNGISGGFNTGEPYIIDHTSPFVKSIKRLTPGTEMTSSSSITFQIEFSEGVTGVDKSDFLLSTTPSVSGVIANVSSSGGISIDVTVNSIDGDGTIRLDLKTPASTGITDAAGNTITAGFDTGEVYDVDRIAPSVVSINRFNPENEKIKSSSVIFRMTLTENVQGIGINDFVLISSGTSISAAIDSVTVSGVTADVTINNIAGDGSISLNLKDSGTGITDSWGNPIAGGHSSDQVYILDNTAPVISSVYVPAAALYRQGAKLTFIVNFNEDIVISGSSLTLDIDVGGVTRRAIYKSSSGNSITFGYTVPSGDNDSDGITVSKLTLNGDQITDAVGNVFSSITLNHKTEALIDSTIPTVASVDLPLPDTYVAGEKLSFTLNFSEKVLVSGADSTLGIDIGGVKRIASLQSAVDNKITFEYEVQPGDNDINGITVEGVNLNGETITDSAGNSADTTLSSIDTTGIKIDAVVPTVTTVTVPAGKTYVAGETLNFTVNFSEGITVGGSGTPKLQLVLDSGAVNADYVQTSGSAILFNYIVTSGDNTSGITVGAIQLGTSSIADSAGNSTNLTLNNTQPTSGIKIDTKAPAVSSVTVPAAKSYKAGDALNFTVNFDENINVSGSGVKLGVKIGAATKEVALDLATANSLTFKYTIQSGDNDSDGIEAGILSLGSATIKDAAGNNADITLKNVNSTTGIIVDTSAPAVTSVSVPSNGTYKEGDVLSFAVNLSENVNVTGSSLTLGIKIGANTRNAQYSSENSSPDKLVFRYTIQAGELDTNGIEIDTIALNSSTITDLAGNIAQLALNSVGPTDGILVDAIVPEITSITLPPNKTYKADDVLKFKVNFSEDINVVGTDSTLSLNIGGVSKTAAYETKGTDSITFSYKIASGENDIDGITLGAITLNTTTIKDATGNNADITIKGVGSTAGIKVDTAAPVVTGVSVPESKIYKAGDILDFTVSFGENLTVSAVDITLGLDVGGEAKLAAYKSKTANTITFSYTVQAGDNDTDGISVGVLALNTTTLRDIAGNDAIPALNGIESTAAVKVDTTAPTVLSVSVPVAKVYKTEEKLDFTVNFSEGITLSGTALTLDLNIGGATKHAAYKSTAASGITFEYAVQQGDNDADGITVGAITLNGAVIKDIAGNSANTALSGIESGAGVIVDTTVPTVKAVSVPANKTYKAGEALNFTVQFNEKVTVSGIDAVLGLQIGEASRSATYKSSADDSVVFSYTVQNGDDAPNGITVGAITLKGTTIVDIAGNSANTALSAVPSTVGIKVDALSPAITKVEVPDNKLYKLGQVLSFTVGFNEKVTVTGVPKLQLQLGSGSVNADCISGSGSSALIFNYTIKSGDNSTGGITVSSIQLDSASIKDAIGNDATLTLNNVQPTSGIKIDTKAPAVSSVTVPAAKSYKAGEVLNLTVNFDENINISGSGIKLGLTIGTLNKDAVLDSSTVNSLTFKYTIQSGDNDSDGIEVGALALGSTIIKDVAGNNADITLKNVDSTTGIIVDTTAPTVSTVSVPIAKTYISEDILSFTVKFNENITVSGSSLTLGLTLGGAAKNAVYKSSTSDSITFEYKVQAGDNAVNGITIGAINLNGAAIKDTAGNNANTLLNGVAPTNGVKVDAVSPAVTTVTVPDNKWYKAEDTLSFKVNFDENVIVAGVPELRLELESGIVNAAYKSGSGTLALVFTYQVQSGDNGSGITVSGIQLGTSTIKDEIGNNAILNLNGINTATGIKIDTLAPAVTSVSVPVNSNYKAGDTLAFTVKFSEGIEVSGSGITLGLDMGGAAKNASYQSKTADSIIFSYTVQAGDNAANGITVSAITLNAATLKDAAGNSADTTLKNIGSTTGVKVDTTAPTVVSVSVPVSKTFITGEKLSFTVNFSEGITLSGTALALDLNIAGATKHAAYKLSAASSITFEYTVQPGDNDADGITVGAIALNGAVIKDIAGNSAIIALNSVGDTTGIRIDSAAPSVISVSAPENKAYKAGDMLEFIVNFDENIQVSGSGITLGIGIGNSTKQASVKATSSSGITFDYTVQSGDNAANGITLGAISLNGAAIKDNAGNTANLLLHNVSTLGGIIIDTTGPAILSASIPPSDSYVDITFNEGVYGANDGATALTKGAFKLVFTQNGGLATNVSISAITKNDKEAEAAATPLSGGETVVRVFFKITGSLRSGVETVQIKPANVNSIFDKLGNAISADQITDAKKLHDNRPHSDSPSSSSSSGNSPSVPASNTSSVIIKVNGVVQENIGTASTTTINNVVATTIIVDEKKLEDKLEKEGQKSVVTIPVNNTGVVVGQLNGQIVKNMEQKEAVLEIKTENVTYVLPATEINIDDISKEIGKQVELKDIKVSVKIADSNPQTATIVQSTASKEKYEIVVKPVDFEITCSSSNDSRVVSVSRFNSYVERTVAIPDGVDPRKITTGVVLNNDGTFSHVPTTVFKGTDGRYYAKINSLSNSTYTVIWNPVTFKDVENHWAKEYVNNIGSRLIDEGVGNGYFAPDKDITRAEFAAMIAKALGLKASVSQDKFSDVKKTNKYYNYIYAAYEYGIITGYTNGKFGPDDLITRQDAMTMIARAMKIAGLSNTVAQDDVNKILKDFTDSADISSYAKQSAAACIKNGLFSGNKGKLTPSDNYTRAESATVIIRLLKQAKLIE